MLFNFLAMPWLAQRQIVEVDYGTFMDMAEEKNLGVVEIQEQENQILFTDKEQTTVYKTGMVPDPDLKQMLRDSGASFEGEIIQQADPLLTFLLSWCCPSSSSWPWGVPHPADDEERRRAQRPVLREEQRKIYVKSTPGHPLFRRGRGGRGQGEPAGDRGLPPRPGQIPLHRRHHAQGRAAGGPAGHRQDHAGQGRGRRGPTCPSSPCPARSLWRCLWAWGPARCGISSSRPRRRPPVSCSSTRSTPSARSATPAPMAATTSGSRP